MNEWRSYGKFYGNDKNEEKGRETAQLLGPGELEGPGEVGLYLKSYEIYLI